MIERVVVATDPVDCKDFRARWGVSSTPAYLNRLGQSLAGEEAVDWSIVLTCWHDGPVDWFCEFDCERASSSCLLIHAGGGNSLDNRRVPGLARVRREFGSRLLVWSVGGSGGPKLLGEWLRSLAQHRENEAPKSFETHLAAMLNAIRQGIAESGKTTDEERRADLVAQLLANSQLAGVLPPDPVSVFIHDTVGALDLLAVDLSIPFDKDWGIREFNEFWDGKAWLGVRRLRAWLGIDDTDDAWVEGGGFVGWEPLGGKADLRARIERHVRAVPEIVARANGGRCREADVGKEAAEELADWLEELLSLLENLR